MKFLFDEGLPFRMVTFLEAGGHDVAVCGHDHPYALDDRQILAIAFATQRILLTNDKGFGDLVFRDRQPHAGVILFRLGYVPIDVRLAYLRQVLSDHAHDLEELSFVVISPRGSRIASA